MSELNEILLGQVFSCLIYLLLHFGITCVEIISNLSFFWLTALSSEPI